MEVGSYLEYGLQCPNDSYFFPGLQMRNDSHSVNGLHLHLDRINALNTRFIVTRNVNMDYNYINDSYVPHQTKEITYIKDGFYNFQFFLPYFFTSLM